jgi:hypothetical protein
MKRSERQPKIAATLNQSPKLHSRFVPPWRLSLS